MNLPEDLTCTPKSLIDGGKKEICELEKVLERIINIVISQNEQIGLGRKVSQSTQQKYAKEPHKRVTFEEEAIILNPYQDLEIASEAKKEDTINPGRRQQHSVNLTGNTSIPAKDPIRFDLRKVVLLAKYLSKLRKRKNDLHPSNRDVVHNANTEKQNKHSKYTRSRRKTL